MSDKFDDVLIHHGVKGMKWGVRRSKDALDRAAGRIRPSRKERATQQRRKDMVSRRRTISDRDLESLIKRLEQEKRLKTLVNEDLRPGRSFAKRTVATSGTKVVSALATGIGVAAVAAILSRNWGDSKAGAVAEAIAKNMPKIKK